VLICLNKRPDWCVRHFWFRQIAKYGKFTEIVKIAIGIVAVTGFIWLAFAPLRAAEYYRWVDENGVLHITDNLHNVPPKQRGSAGRIQAQESPRVAEPEQKPPPRKASIPMERHGEVVIIQATLNNKHSAKFVVDTGASYTLISNALARDLSIDVGPTPKTLQFQTANGLIQAPVTSLESIAVGGMEIRNLPTAVHDAVPDPQVAGLLGLNFLSNFRMDIDTQKGLLHLEKK
jgi:clan AA aspartic protease (TIGR02281 family)